MLLIAKTSRDKMFSHWGFRNFKDLGWTPGQPLVALGDSLSTELDGWDKDAICFPNKVWKSNLEGEQKGPNLTEAIYRAGGLAS